MYLKNDIVRVDLILANTYAFFLKDYNDFYVNIQSMNEEEKIVLNHVMNFIENHNNCKKNDNYINTLK